MTNIEYIEKTIDYFEVSLESGNLPVYTTVSAISAKIGYTPHYLSRLFSSICNISLGQYMLKRRLSTAYISIRDTREQINEIALKLGWEDYSSFSRAFRKEFNTVPGALRKRSSMLQTPPLTWRARPKIQSKGTGQQEPEIIRMPGLHVSGLVFFMDRSAKTFHKPWNLYMKYENRISNAVQPSITYQCSAWPEESEDAPEGLWILCGKETIRGKKQDPIFFSRQFPSHNVLCFKHKEPLDTIYRTYTYIWQEYFPLSPSKPAGNFEFQRYNKDSDVIEILIPVENAVL